MKALAVVGRDLVLDGGSYRFVDGASKVVQDLRLALGEPLGTDRFHPGWGSQLDQYVGLPLVESTRFAVEQEVARVAANYAAVQRDRIRRDTLAGDKSRFKTADVLTQVDQIRVTSDADAVRVAVTVRTADGQTVVVTAGS